MQTDVAQRPASDGRIVRLAFTATLTLSAALVFWIQPMFAKMVLPMLGGTPAVWNTSMVFFQASLLAGYAYAHYSTRLLDLRHQSLLHLVILAIAFLAMPIGVATGWSPPPTTPVFWLLALLTVSIGLPFFAVSATAPLLQKWFAHTRNEDAANPYFLYAASNIGSIAALLAYPLLIEPYLGLVIQGWVWSIAYTALFALVGTCALLMWKRFVAEAPDTADDVDTGLESNVTAGLRLRWTLLAFVPSSLLLAVTAHITTDLASVPLLWIIPLVLYLLTYVIVFSRKPLLPHLWMVKLQSYLVLGFVVVLYAVNVFPLPFTLLFHLLTFFVTAMVCHRELANRRPTTTHLTEFYLWMSVGGVLGGMFNALLAPLIFDFIAEYPIAIVLACALRPLFDEETRGKWVSDIAWPAGLGLILIAMYFFDPVGYVPAETRSVAFGLLAAVAAMVVFGFSPRPLRFALGVAILVVGANLAPLTTSAVRADFMARSFFGVHKVIQDAEAGVYTLMHGSTIHGAQAIDPSARREPLGYYVEHGPVGQLFTAIDGNPEPRRVGIVGLGAGSMACYRRSHDDWVFYEIDAVVLELARDARYFHYLNECAGNSDTILGDARLSLAEESDRRFDLLVIDAFSSDSIPLNLITREAIELYLERLTDDGILAIHISNNYLDLEPVIGNLAQDLKLAARIQRFEPTQRDSHAQSHGSIHDYQFASAWTALARRESDLHSIAKDERWTSLRLDESVGLWTDDYSNIVRVLRW